MIAPEELHTRLRTHRVGHLATADATGVPHIVPVCFVYDGEALYSAIDHKPKRRTGYSMKRVRNMLENPRVAFLVDHYDEDWQQLYYVLVRGTAAILEQGEEYHRALTLLEAKYAQYRERRLRDVAGLVVKIVPETIQHWGWQEAVRADA